jgi:cytochrome c peroxidase
VAAGCGARPSTVAVDAGTVEDDRVAAFVRRTAAEALAVARSDGEVLALRRAVARGAWAWRVVASPAVEVLIGPLRGGDEEAGAMARLDRALVAGDAREALEARRQIAQALVLVEGEARRRGGGERVRLAQALSDAAYEVGLMALEATRGTPEMEGALTADLSGLLEGIVDGARAILDDDGAEVGRRGRALAGRVDGLGDRASFVVETGALGVEIRRLAARRGLRVRPPYAPRVVIAGVSPEEQPVSALTVPAARPSTEEIDGATVVERVALGERLFHDRRLSRRGVRACADCHQPARAFTDGLRTPRSLVAAKPIARNTPTLLYAALSPALFWDGRVITGEGQALAVLHAPSEMGVDDAALVEALGRDAAIVARFRRAFPSEELTARNVARAIVAYEEHALVPATAPIDRFARGEAGALDDETRRGLDVFAGAGRCARCHVPPLFAGARPPDFSVPIYAVVGVPRSPRRGAALDGDPGRAAVTARAIDRGAMKTPTVRNVAATAPYFHHGAFASLEEVVALYDDGGGRGRGLTVDNQDPDVRPLRLSADERRALLAFLRRALADRAPR